MILKKFNVDEEKRQCVCVLTIKPSFYGFGYQTFVGYAKCSPNDSFDEKRGKELAYVRALIKLKKAECDHDETIAKSYEGDYLTYLAHQRNVEFNTKRLVELKEELKELTK